MNLEALSEWDRQRLTAATHAFREAVGEVELQPGELSAGLLAAIRAVDALKPPEARSVLPMPAAPKRYDSLGRPVVNEPSEPQPSQT